MYNLLTDREKQLVDYAIQKALESVGYVKPVTKPRRMSQRQAFKEYGEGIVRRWVRHGKITFERRGVCKNSTKSVLIEDIEQVYQSEKKVAVIFKQNLYK